MSGLLSCGSMWVPKLLKEESEIAMRGNFLLDCVFRDKLDCVTPLRHALLDCLSVSWFIRDT